MLVGEEPQSYGQNFQYLPITTNLACGKGRGLISPTLCPLGCTKIHYKEY